MQSRVFSKFPRAGRVKSGNLQFPFCGIDADLGSPPLKWGQLVRILTSCVVTSCVVLLRSILPVKSGQQRGFGTATLY